MGPQTPTKPDNASPSDASSFKGESLAINPNAAPSTSGKRNRDGEMPEHPTEETNGQDSAKRQKTKLSKTGSSKVEPFSPSPTIDATKERYGWFKDSWPGLNKGY